MQMVRVPVENPVTEYLHRKASIARVPLSGTFELTPVCNMDCKMCYVRMSKEEQEAVRPLRSADEWIALGKEAKDEGMLYLLLTGGEPFLHPEFKEILQSLHKMGLIISINSNGTLIDERVVEWLKETPPTRINITLYGTSDETYARLCRNPKGYTQATKAIKMLNEAGINVKLNASLTPHNVDDLEGICQFAAENGLILQGSSYMFPPLRRDKSMIGQNDRFMPEEAAYQAAKIEHFQIGDERFLEKVERQEEVEMPDEMAEYYLEPEAEGDKIWCRAGKCTFWITWEGTMLPCGMMPMEGLKNVFVDGFDDAWQCAVKSVEEIRLPVKCKSCELKKSCKACAAMVMTESGDFSVAPEYRCQMTKAFAAQCKRLAQEIIVKGDN